MHAPRGSMNGGGVVVCGGGLAGLAAGHALARAGREVTVLEREPGLGGLARTLEHRGQRFDLGGHRLLTDSARVHALVSDVVREPLLRVARSSKILLRGRSVEYPLRPLDAVSGLGPAATLRTLIGYLASQLVPSTRRRPIVSLEDWVVRHYGRPAFELFFRPYSEKVWGLSCTRISADWVAQRIQGLTLGDAIRRSLLRVAGRGPRTLASEFLYPTHGIGSIADGLGAAIAAVGRVTTGAVVTRVTHHAGRIEHVTVNERGRSAQISGADFVSSLPLPVLVRALSPVPPARVLAAAACLRYRDLLLVAVRIARERATGETWIYVPGEEFSFGRLHEPKNWSPSMGTPDETLLVAEHFCRRGDEVWGRDDGELLDRTVSDLVALGLVRSHEVLDGVVVRVPNAYPQFEVGYAKARGVLMDYLAGFDNLHVVGRTGAFRYHNMDHALEAGLGAADALLERADAAGAAPLRTGTDP